LDPAAVVGVAADHGLLGGVFAAAVVGGGVELDDLALGLEHLGGPDLLPETEGNAVRQGGFAGARGAVEEQARAGADRGARGGGMRSGLTGMSRKASSSCSRRTTPAVMVWASTEAT